MSEEHNQLDLAGARARLDGARGREYWRSLEDLAATPEFRALLEREFPQQALRACTSLASVYHTIARTLFNSAFISCWSELYDQYQEELVHAIEMGSDAEDIALTIHPHPTLTETVMFAAEMAEGTITDLYVPKRARSAV